MMIYKSTKSKIVLTVVALAAVVSLSACGSSNSASSTPAASSAPSTSAPAAAAGGETKEITISAKNFEFDQKEIKAKVGDTIKLTLKNTDGVHGLAAKDLNVNIKNGETATIKLDKAGTYEFNCSIMCGTGHDGMTGEIIVE